MTAKETAIRDIQEALAKKSRSFITYHKELDPIMDSLVNEQISSQEEKGKEKKVLRSFERIIPHIARLCSTSNGEVINIIKNHLNKKINHE